MLKRAAQLAHYSVQQLRWQKNLPECLKRELKEADEPPLFFEALECVEWEE